MSCISICIDLCCVALYCMSCYQLHCRKLRKDSKSFDWNKFPKSRPCSWLASPTFVLRWWGKETQKLTKVATFFSSLWKSLFNFKIVISSSARNNHITFSNKMFNICRHGKVLFFVNSNKIWSSKARRFLLHTGWFFYWSLPIDKND